MGLSEDTIESKGLTQTCEIATMADLDRRKLERHLERQGITTTKGEIREIVREYLRENLRIQVFDWGHHHIGEGIADSELRISLTLEGIDLELP